MQTTAIHWIGEYDKMFIYEETLGAVKTTYMWFAPYFWDEKSLLKNFRTAADFASPIFKIKKIVETTVGWVKTTETFYPIKDWKPFKNFWLIRDDWSSNFLNYTYL